MFAQNNRLRKKTDFERVFKNGNKASNHYFVIRFLRNGMADCRFGIIISNKISKKATERNRIRRQIREAFNEILPNFKQKIDIVIVVLADVVKLNKKELKENILNLAKKNQIYG